MRVPRFVGELRELARATIRLEAPRQAVNDCGGDSVKG
jgi:hypothetical protein